MYADIVRLIVYVVRMKLCSTVHMGCRCAWHPMNTQRGHLDEEGDDNQRASFSPAVVAVRS